MVTVRRVVGRTVTRRELAQGIEARSAETAGLGSREPSPDRDALKVACLVPEVGATLVSEVETWSAVSFHEDTRMVMQTAAYIFSASSEVTRDLSGKIAETFEADACVCISDPQEFIKILSQHPLLRGRDSEANYVTYVDGSNEFKELKNVEPFKKLRKFDWQKEFRIVWDGDVPADGSVIEVPDIVPLLSQI